MDDRRQHQAVQRCNPPGDPHADHAPAALQGRKPARRWGTSARSLLANVVTLLLVLCLLPQTQAQFVSVCGTAPSGLNDCPWYQVEIVIFRNDNARAVSVEDLAGEAEPRWSPRLATLLPPADEDFMPMRTAEYLALWQSAGQAPQWLQVTPGLTLEQESYLHAIDDIGIGIGIARHPIDLGFLDELDPLAWEAPTEQDDVLDDLDAGGLETEERSLPDLAPIVVIAQPLPELTPEVELVEVPDLTGAIPMDLAFREVPAGQRLLDGEAARLRRARGFEVLGQLAWRQPFAPNEAGLAQLIYSGDLAESGPARMGPARMGPAGPGLPGAGLPEGELLLGTLTVDLRRFLHAHLDLYFKAAAPPLDASSPEGSIDDPPMALEEAPEPRWIHVKQSRRMRSGELHYLDHPWIGAIIRIEPYEAPTPEE